MKKFTYCICVIQYVLYDIHDIFNIKQAKELKI